MAAFLLAVALHVIVAGHRPDVPPDGLAPAARLARAASPLAALVDRLAPPYGVLPADVQPVPLVLLASAGTVSAIWMRRLALPPLLSVIVGVSLTMLPHAWTRHGVGVDPLMLLAALAAAASVAGANAGRSRGMLTTAAATTGALYAPASVWIAIPALVARGGHQQPAARRVMLAVLAIVAIAGTASAAWPVLNAMCGAGRWPGALAAVWLPALNAHASSGARVGAVLSALRMEWHPFLLLVAALGAWTHGAVHPVLRRAAIGTFVTALVAAAVGAADADVVVPWLDAFMLPWYGLGCLVLWQRTTGVTAIAARSAVAAAVLGLPLLLHADRWTGPLANDVPALRGAAFAHAAGQPVIVDSTQAARIGRRHGASLIPGTTAAIAGCAAGGRPPLLLGSGLPGEPLAYHVHVDGLTADLTAGAQLAVALGADAGQWLRPRDAGALEAFGLPPDLIQRREAVAAVGSRPFDAIARARPPDTARQAAEGARWLKVEARADDNAGVVTQGAADRLLAIGDLGAIVVFDEAEQAAFVGLPVAEPGLPLRVHTRMPALRLARVSASAVAVEADGDRAPLLPRRRPRAVDALSAHEVDVHAGNGWHTAEPVGDASFRWSAATPAEAGFFLAAPQRLRLRVDAAAASLESAPNALSLALNGHLIATDLDGPREIDVGADTTRAGLNVLTFETRQVLAPGTVAGEPRPLGAIVRDVRVTRQP